MKLSLFYLFIFIVGLNVLIFGLYQSNLSFSILGVSSIFISILLEMLRKQKKIIDVLLKKGILTKEDLNETF